MKTAVVLRHIAVEGLGVFEDVLREQGFAITYVDVWKDDIAAALQRAPDLLVVLGGPMGVYETDAHPYLLDEFTAVRARLASGKPMLGICLGAQIIAHAAGGRVYPGAEREIGYMPMTLTPEGEASCLTGLSAANFRVLHWHGDTFDLPPGAVRLCQSALTANQAFTLGPNVLALQFHMEALPEHMERWVEISADYLAGAGVDVSDLRADAAAYGQRAAETGAKVFGAWIKEIDWNTARVHGA